MNTLLGIFSPFWIRPSGKVLAAVALVFAIPAITGSAAEPVKNNLQLWLTADAGVTASADGSVTAWADQSGKGNNASQLDETAAPKLVSDAINGKPVLRFDGDNDYLDIATAPSIEIVGDITSFFVVKFDDFSNWRAVWGKTTANTPAPTDYYLVTGTGVPRVYRGDGGSIGNVDATRPVRTGTYLILGFDMAGTRLTHYLNGQAIGAGDITATIGDGGTPLKIGSREDLVTKMKGDIAELVIYDAALSEADRNSVVGYLQTKYNIVNLPPAVSLTSPAQDANVTPPANLTVEATASDPDGSIAKVDFFANGALLGTATAPPYRLPVSVEAGSSISFTAVATDNKDTAAASAPRTVTVAAGTAPTLTVKDGLQLWLEADQGLTTGAGDAVAVWADQSGKGNDAAPADPSLAPALAASAINGKPAVRFDGVDDYLDVAHSPSLAITGDIASFFVVKFDDYVSFRAVWGKTAGNVPRPTDYYLLPGSGIPRVFRGSDAGNGSVDGFGSVPTNYVVLGFSMAGSTMTHFLNGQPFGSGNMSVTPADAESALKIGSRDDLFTKMKGDIAALLIYDRALPSTDQKALATYLGAKYGLPIVFSANSAPTVSLTAPTAGATFQTPTNITLTATAADPSGSIVRVEFFANDTPVGSATTTPFTAQLAITTAGDLNLTAVATDNFGVKTTSAAIAVRATGAADSPLKVQEGLQLWLRADEGVTTNPGGGVSDWADSSGKFNKAAQADASLAPLLVANAVNGKPALRFDGANDYLEVASSPSVAITGDITSFFLVQFDDFATFRAVWAKTENNLPRPTDFYTLPESGLARVFRGGPAGIGNVDSFEPVPMGSYAIIGFDMAGTTLTHYNGTTVIGSGEITATPVDAGTPLRIGTRGDLFTKMKGDIAEILIYDRALTEQERIDVVGYLTTKYLTIVDRPTIKISRAANGSITLEWTGTILTEASDVGGPWTPVAGATSPRPITPTGERKFYRSGQ